MNILDENLNKGDKVVDRDGHIWTVTGGFGMSSFTRGTAIFAKRDSDGVEARIECMINPDKTKALRESLKV